VKYEVFELSTENRKNVEKELCRGNVSKIGSEFATAYMCKPNKEPEIDVFPVKDHAAAIEVILKTITAPETGVITHIKDLDGIGHRVVHGGDKYTESLLITDEVKQEIYRNIELTPLHNPFNYNGIEAIEKLCPGIPQVAVFDTSFHQTMDECAYRYPIAERLYHEHRVRRYGFHGISHRYVLERAAVLLNKPQDKLSLISLHLGAGTSACAIRNGKSVDTTMGFTPLEGLMMSTRSGSVDPELVFFLHKAGWELSDIRVCLNYESGILGVSGISGEMKDVVIAMLAGDKRAKLTVDMYVYQLRKIIGSYFLILKNTDAIVFTAGIGEKSDIIREMVCDGLEFIGVKIDTDANNEANSKEAVISVPDAGIKVLVIPGNEKLLIARDVANIISKTEVLAQ